MKLQDALQKIIRKYGTVILGEKRLVFLLDDYRSFADYPAVRPIMKAIAEDGYGKELCEAAEIHDMEFVSSSNDLKETLTEKHGFRKDLAEYAVSCISFAMGFEESVDEPLDHGFDPNGKTAPEPRKDESDENDGTSSDAAENPEGPESADEQYELGNAYFHGNGREKNCYEAVKWWRRAAEQGHAGAQYSLGFFGCEQGLGAEKDDAAAAMWYRKAAEQGHAQAQCSLGFMYLCGTGVAKDYAEAFRWFQKSAMQGNPGGQYMLGNMYSSGEGVERNDKEAIRWYHKAVKQGYPHAGEDLDRLLERMRRESQQKEERPESSASSSGERQGTATGTRPQITPSVFLRKRTGAPEEGKDERPRGERASAENGAPHRSAPEQEARPAHKRKNVRRFQLLSPSEWFTVDGRIGRLEFLIRYLIILLPLVAVHYLWCLDHKSCVSADGVFSGCTGIRGVPFQDIAHILGYGVMALRWYSDLPGWLIVLTAVPLWLAFVCAFYSAWIRRAHDLGGNGYTLIFAFITGMAFYLSILCLLGFAHAKSNTVYIVLLVIDAAGLGLWGYYGLRKGMNGTNYYGADPGGEE